MIVGFYSISDDCALCAISVARKMRDMKEYKIEDDKIFGWVFGIHMKV